MQPIELVSKRKGWQVVHRCTRCGKTQPNKVASATHQADDIEALVELSRH
jgi:RNHCP domain